MKRKPLILFVGIFLVVVVFLPLLCVFQVRQSEVAVVTTFGKPARTITEAGAYGKWPPPIQSVHKFDRRIQNFAQDKYDESLTLDSYNLLTTVYVGWRIKDAQAFFPKFQNGSIEVAESTLEGLVRSAKNAVVGKHPLSDFVSTNEKELKFTQIEGEILKIVQEQVNTNNYGIEMVYLGIRKMGFPETVTQEVFKQMTSARNVLISKLQNEGEADATRIRSAADNKSLEMVAAANSEATRIKGEAQAEAAQSFAIFQQNPDLASFLLNLDAFSESLKARTTLIFDQNSKPFNLFQDSLTDHKK